MILAFRFDEEAVSISQEKKFIFSSSLSCPFIQIFI